MSCFEDFRPSTIRLKPWPKAISCLVLLLIYERIFCKEAFRSNLQVFSIAYDQCSICIVQSSLSPPTGDKWDQSHGAKFCYREVKRVIQQLIFSWEVERNDPREDKCEVVGWCSTARFFLLSFSFIFGFHPLLEIGKNTPITSTVIFLVEAGVVWNKGETSIVKLQGNRKKNDGHSRKIEHADS